MPSAYRGSVHRFQRQADGTEPGPPPMGGEEKLMRRQKKME